MLLKNIHNHLGFAVAKHLGIAIGIQMTSGGSLSNFSSTLLLPSACSEAKDWLKTLCVVHVHAQEWNYVACMMWLPHHQHTYNTINEHTASY